MPNRKNKLDNQSDAVLHFIEQLDVDMVDELLDSDRTYSDLEKPIFINKLDLALDRFIKAGDTCLTRSKGVCTGQGCDNIGCSGYSFMGDKSGLFLDVVVIENKGRVEDIFDCSALDVEGSTRKRGKRVRITKWDLPF